MRGKVQRHYLVILGFLKLFFYMFDIVYLF